MVRHPRHGRAGRTCVSDQTLHDVCVVATWSFCIPQHVHLGLLLRQQMWPPPDVLMTAISCFRSLRGFAKPLLPMFWRRISDTGRVVTPWSFADLSMRTACDANTRFPLVPAGTSHQKAPAANPVGDFFGLAHFAACLDVGHGACRRLLHRLDCILFARIMGTV